MTNLHAELMTEKQVHDSALPIVRERLGDFGFQNIVVTEEEDFDGAYVFRMVAHVGQEVPARVLSDAINEIHRALRKRGEQRFVYLSTSRPDDTTEPDEDVE